MIPKQANAVFYHPLDDLDEWTTQQREAGGRVPWSISGYSPTELATLLDSRQMFVWYAGGASAPASYRIRHTITSEDTRGWSTPATAEHAWGFMQDKIGASRIETIGSVLEWFRGAVHFSGSHRYGNCDDHWQYRGYVPAIRVIEGRAGVVRVAAVVPVAHADRRKPYVPWQPAV